MASPPKLVPLPVPAGIVTLEGESQFPGSFPISIRTTSNFPFFLAYVNLILQAYKEHITYATPLKEAMEASVHDEWCCVITFADKRVRNAFMYMFTGLECYSNKKTHN